MNLRDRAIAGAIVIAAAVFASCADDQRGLGGQQRDPAPLFEDGGENGATGDGAGGDADARIGGENKDASAGGEGATEDGGGGDGDIGEGEPEGGSSADSGEVPDGEAGDGAVPDGSDGEGEDSGCEPDCSGRECGDDGCGGSCGECQGCSGPSPELCNDGTCLQVCCPNCAGKSCGDDGCGGVCGTCAANETCTSGACQCVPACGGNKVCGDDGCGGSCGVCRPNHDCRNGACIALSGDCVSIKDCPADNFCRSGVCLPDTPCLSGETCYYDPDDGKKYICIPVEAYQGHFAATGKRAGKCDLLGQCESGSRCVFVPELYFRICMGECSSNQVVDMMDGCGFTDTCRLASGAPPEGGYCWINGWEPGRAAPLAASGEQNGPCDVVSGLSECQHGAVCTNLGSTGQGICLHPCDSPQSQPICPAGLACSMGHTCKPVNPEVAETPYTPDPGIYYACGPAPDYDCGSGAFCSAGLMCEPLCVWE